MAIRTALVQSEVVTNASGVTRQFRVPRGAKGFALGAVCDTGGTLLIQALREDGAETPAWDTLEGGSITLAGGTRIDAILEAGGGTFRVDYTPSSDSTSTYIDFAEVGH
jgi:hypothetical protein